MTAFIFDLDGTLIRSESLFFDAAEAMFNRLGHSLTELTALERSRIPGRSAAENMAFYLEKFGLEGDPVQMAEERLMQLLVLLKQRGVPLVPGAEDFLMASKRAGISMALATSSPANYVAAVFDATGLGRYFDQVVTGDDITRYKPDPEIFLLAAARLDAIPNLCVVFEDAHAGFLAARAANMRLVSLPSPFTLPSQRDLADLVVEDFTQLSPEQCVSLVSRTLT